MLLAVDRLKLSDFAVAREIETSVTAGVGTYWYMAPEVIETRSYGHPADIFSLAISIWEIFHRKIPYEDLGEDHFRRMVEIVNGLRPTIDTNLVDEDMGALLKRAWSNNPIDRPRTKDIIDFFLLKSENRKMDFNKMLMPGPSEEAQNLDSDIAPSSSRSGQKLLSLSALLVPISLTSECKFLERIGIGGQAVVHKCRHDRLGDVAVKQFDKLEGSTKEIRILTQCPKHDHVMEILEVIHDESNHVNCLAYIMEYAPGGSFNQVIYGDTYYDALQCYRWLMQIASGLQHLHKHNIIHRDIKPHNILVINKNYLKLSDFGVARFVNGTTLTSDVGTPRYMAPEVIETNTYDFSADIYSLSITIWETLYRRKPFSELGEISDFKLKTEVVSGTRPAMDANPKVQLDDGMAAFIKSCWHPTAAKRPITDNVVTFITGRVRHPTPPTNKCKVQ